MTQPVRSNDWTIFQTACLGAARSIAGFPVEHPLELLKLSAQAAPEKSSAGVARGIFLEKGLSGFANTSSVNLSRRVLRESARWPVIGYIHNTLAISFPSLCHKEGLSSKVVTAVCVALFESAVILPLEQLMAFRVKEQKTYRDFFKSRFRQEGLPSLYKGLCINLIRQGALWITFISINHLSKKSFDAWDKTGSHPYLRQGVTSMCVAAGLTAWVLPIDFVKTRIQMEPNLQNMKLTDATKLLLQRAHGIKGFYAGTLPLCIHTVIHATLGGQIIDRLLR